MAVFEKSKVRCDMFVKGKHLEIKTGHSMYDWLDKFYKSSMSILRVIESINYR